MTELTGYNSYFIIKIFFKNQFLFNRIFPNDTFNQLHYEMQIISYCILHVYLANQLG